MGLFPSKSGSYRRWVTGQRSGETETDMVEEIPCQVIFSSPQKKPVCFWPRARLHLIVALCWVLSWVRCTLPRYGSKGQECKNQSIS